MKTGDQILFLPQAGLEVELNGEEYLLLRERDVQAMASTPEKERQPGPVPLEPPGHGYTWPLVCAKCNLNL